MDGSRCFAASSAIWLLCCMKSGSSAHDQRPGVLLAHQGECVARFPEASALPQAESSCRASVLRPGRLSSHLGLDGLIGFTRTATRDSLGTMASSISSCFGLMSPAMFERPVMLPPGRARLLTKPAADRVADAAHDDRDRGGGFLRRARGGRARCHDDVHFQTAPTRPPDLEGARTSLRRSAIR